MIGVNHCTAGCSADRIVSSRRRDQPLAMHSLVVSGNRFMRDSEHDRSLHSVKRAALGLSRFVCRTIIRRLVRCESVDVQDRVCQQHSFVGTMFVKVRGKQS